MAVPMFVPAPIVRKARPIHVETIFQDQSRAPSLTRSHRSADSVDSSVASPTYTRYDAEPKYQQLRNKSPVYGEDNDRSSLRSFALSFSFKKPKWGLLKKLQRRGQPAVVQQRSVSAMEGPTMSRKISLSSLSSHIHSRQNSSMLNLNPKPASTHTQLESVPELSSRKCYYSIARNCPGWVLGGSHGDACEACLRAGFFGSP